MVRSGSQVGLEGVEAKLADGRTIKGALAKPQGQANGSILLIHEWWGLVRQSAKKRGRVEARPPSHIDSLLTAR